MSDNTKLATTFRAAAAYLAEHGWRQGHRGTHGGPRCLNGALLSATRPMRLQEDRLLREVRFALERYLFTAFPHTCFPDYCRSCMQGRQSIEAWNDGAGRTINQVIDTLLALAAELDPDGVVALDPIPTDASGPARSREEPVHA